MSQLNRSVVVDVKLQGSGDLAQKLAQAKQEAGRLSQAVQPVGQGLRVRQQQTVRAGLSQEGIALQAELRAEQLRRRLAFEQTRQGDTVSQRQLGFQGALRVDEQEDRLRFSRSRTGRAQSQQGGVLREQQQAVDLENRLTMLRSGPGVRALIEQSRLQRQIGLEQQRIENTARYGRVGGAVVTASDRLAPAFGAARTGAAVGTGLMGAAIGAAYPPALEHLANSARLLGGELGLTLIPHLVRLSGWLQSGARYVRGMSEETRGAAGSFLFWGTAALGLTAGLGTLWSSISGGIRLVGTLAEGFGSAARGLGSLAGVARAAPAAASAGGGGGMWAGAGALALHPATLAVAASVAAAEGLREAAPSVRRGINERAPSTRDPRTLGGAATEVTTGLMARPYSTSLSTLLLTNPITAPLGALLALRNARDIARTSMAGGNPAAGGLETAGTRPAKAAGLGIEDLRPRETTLLESVEQILNRNITQAGQQPGSLAELEARGQQEFNNAIAGNTAAVSELTREIARRFKGPP